MSKLEERVDKLEVAVSKLEESVAKLEEAISKLEERVGNLEVEVSNLKGQVGKLEKRVGNLEKESAVNSENIETLKDIVMIHYKEFKEFVEHNYVQHNLYDAKLITLKEESEEYNIIKNEKIPQ